MSLAVPIHSVYPIGGHLSFLLSNSTSIQENISNLPFPSFSHVQKSTADKCEALRIRDPMGYDEHATFFYPRKIYSDRVRYNTTNTPNEYVFHADHPKSHETASNPALESYGHLQHTHSPLEQEQNTSQTHRLIDQHPKHPFGYTYDDNDGHGRENSKKRSKKQKRLISELDNPVPFERGWEQVGKIPEPFNVTLPSAEQEKKKKKTKKPKKKKTFLEKDSLNSKTSDISQDISTTILPESLSSLTCVLQHNHRRQTQLFPQDYGPTKSLSDDRIKTISMETMELFSETYDVKNAACSKDALNLFLSLVMAQQFLTWTMVFYDDLCSSPFFPSTKKYCTPKGQRCRMWNCICDNQVRAVQASAPILGAMFVFPSQEDEQLDLFFLPLCPINDPENGPVDIDPGYERMASWPSLTISCETTLHERWETLRTILLIKNLTKVTFNAQVGLMPFHYHCAYDAINDDNGDVPKIGYLHLDLPNIWDLR